MIPSISTSASAGGHTGSGGFRFNFGGGASSGGGSSIITLVVLGIVFLFGLALIARR